MSQNIVLTFVLLYGACIALICAVYVALGARRKRKAAALAETKTSEQPIN